MKWHLIPAVDRFGECAECWDALNRRLYGGHPLFDSRFVGPLLSHFGGPQTSLALLGDPVRPSGMLLVEPSKPGVWTSFLPSQWQTSPILLARQDAETLSGLFAAMPPTARVLNLPCQDPRFSPLVGSQAPSKLIDISDHVTSMRIALRGAFEDYWATRSRHLRKNVRRYLARAGERGLAPELAIETAKSAVLEGVRRYGLLESRGWKAARGTALHPDNAQGAFYRDVFERFSDTGQSMYCGLYFGEQLAAARLAIRSERLLVILKTTHDERRRDLAPGRVQLFLMLQRLFADPPAESVEFYTNANADQLAWASEAVPIRNVTLYRSRADRGFADLMRATRGVLGIAGAWGSGGAQTDGPGDTRPDGAGDAARP